MFVCLVYTNLIEIELQINIYHLAITIEQQLLNVMLNGCFSRNLTILWLFVKTIVLAPGRTSPAPDEKIETSAIAI